MTDPKDDRPSTPSRRRFLAAGVAATAMAASGGNAQTSAPSGPPQPIPGSSTDQVPRTGETATPGPQGYRFLTSTEVETLTAMIDRLIPSDSLGPGGVEAGVLTFIDRELGGQFGAAARWYMQGPWPAGSPSQGWQVALTPAEIYRTGLLALDRWCLGRMGKRFTELAMSEQEAVLTLMETGKIDLEGFSSAVFFQILWQNTVEGYLGDPLYGGNRNMAAWKTINFPGANPVLTPAVDLNGELYEIEPIAIGS